MDHFLPLDNFVSIQIQIVVWHVNNLDWWPLFIFVPRVPTLSRLCNSCFKIWFPNILYSDSHFDMFSCWFCFLLIFLCFLMCLFDVWFLSLFPVFSCFFFICVSFVSFFFWFVFLVFLCILLYFYVFSFLFIYVHFVFLFHLKKNITYRDHLQFDTPLSFADGSLLESMENHSVKFILFGFKFC